MRIKLKGPTVMGKWERFFAFLPVVTLDEKTLIWLEYAERRCTYDAGKKWIYREILDK